LPEINVEVCAMAIESTYGSIGNWLAAVVHHWEVIVVTGAIPFFIDLIDKMFDWQMPKKLYVVFVGLGLLLAMFSAWKEERDAKDASFGDKARVESQFNQCDKERAVNDAVAKSCSASLGFQQTRNDGQQDLFNRCLLSLGVSNKPEPASIKISDTSFDGNVGKDKEGKDKRLWVLTAIVNKTTSPFQGTFKCDGDFVVVQGRLAIPNAGDANEIVSNHTLSDGGYRVEYVQPSAWNPNMPMLFIGVAVERPKGCKFKLD
jgi:hypothetical protein